jgi:hypothetical protein
MAQSSQFVETGKKRRKKKAVTHSDEYTDTENGLCLKAQNSLSLRTGG